MSSTEVLVAPINSTEMNDAGQLGALNNAIASGLLGQSIVKNEENTPSENQPSSNQAVTPRKKSTKRSHKKKRTPAEILEQCKITNCNVILSVEPDAKHRSRSRRVRTYHTYEEYLEAKKKALETLDPDHEESEIVSFSEFNMSDDTEAFEDIQLEEKNILEAELEEEKRHLAAELLEQYIQPHSLVEVTPNRNSCYDDVSASIDRGMPGNPLEKEMDEQEARELKEIEEDIQCRNSMLYPENQLLTHLELNFASDLLRNDFAANPNLDESCFSVSEINPDIISLSPGSPRGISQKMRNVCSSGVITLLSVGPDEEKVSAYLENKKNTKRYTHVRRYKTTDKTNELNASLGPMSGAIENVKLESKSTITVFTDSEENYKTEEGLSLKQALTEENQLEEEKVKNSENSELQNALKEEKELNHVFEGRGMSCANNGLTTEYSDLTIYSDEEKWKSSECERLEDEIREEHREEIAEKRREYEEAKNNLPVFPPNDVTRNGDGTVDVGIQAIRCDIDEIINRRPRKSKKNEIPYADYAAYAIQPRVLVNVEPDRNACYDNVNDAIDRGMPGNPLEDELEEQAALEEKERKDDLNYYISTLYKEDSIQNGLQGALDSESLRVEFGNRPPEEYYFNEPKIEEEEEDVDVASSECDEKEIHELAPPPAETQTTSPRLKRRVKKVVHKTADVQCGLIHVEPIEKIHKPQQPATSQEPTTRELSNDENNKEQNETPDSGVLQDTAASIFGAMLNNDKENENNNNVEENKNEENENNNDEQKEKEDSGALQNTAASIFGTMLNMDKADKDEEPEQLAISEPASNENESNNNAEENKNEENENNDDEQKEKEDSGALQNTAASIFGTMLNMDKADTPEIKEPPSNEKEAEDVEEDNTNNEEDKDEPKEKEDSGALQNTAASIFGTMLSMDKADTPEIKEPPSNEKEVEGVEEEKDEPKEKDNSGALENTAASIFGAMLNNDNENEAQSSEKEPLQKIQMPTIDVDSSGLSPRTKSGRQVAFRSSSRNAYRPLSSSRASPRYNTRSLDASSPSINRLKERAYKLEPIANATNEQLELLIDEIEQERKIMMRDRRFKDGLKCNAAIKHVEGILSKQQREQAAPSPETEMEMAFDTESRKKEANLIEKQNLARRKLKAKHKRELENLNNQWNSLQMRKKYNKPSEKLIEMKAQYDAIVASGNPIQIEEANKLKEQIQELRQLETAEAHQKMQADYDRALLSLHQKHHQDFALLSESNNVKFDQFKQQRARERRALDFKKTELNNNESPIANDEKDENGLLGAQSERFESDALGNLFDHAEVPKRIETRDAEKLVLPPLDTRKPTSFRFANPDSS